MVILFLLRAPFMRKSRAAEIIEYCKVKDTLIREKDYIKLFSPEYNIFKNPIQFLMTERKHSEDTLIKMLNFYKGLKAGQNHPMLGQARPEEQEDPLKK
jgi:hypothetical protein